MFRFSYKTIIYLNNLYTPKYLFCSFSSPGILSPLDFLPSSAPSLLCHQWLLEKFCRLIMDSIPHFVAPSRVSSSSTKPTHHITVEVRSESQLHIPNLQNSKKHLHVVVAKLCSKKQMDTQTHFWQARIAEIQVNSSAKLFRKWYQTEKLLAGTVTFLFSTISF